MTLKTKLIIAAGGLALLAGVFFAGRYSAPAKIVTVEKTHTIEVQHEATTVVQKVDIDELKKAIIQVAENVQKNVVKKRTTVIDPSGRRTVTEETTDRSHTDIDTTNTTTDTTKATTNTATNTTKDTTKTTDHQVTTTVTHPTEPGFGLALQLGLNFAHPFDGSQTNYIPQLPKQTVVGLVLERHLLGTVYGGVWGNSRGDGGLQLRLGF